MVALSCFFVCGGPAKLHPLLQAAVASLEAPANAPASEGVLPRGEMEPAFDYSVSPVTGVERIGVLVKTSTSHVGSRIDGLPLRSSTGTIHGMWVTVAELAQLAGLDQVVYVEPAWRIEAKLDVSGPAVGASAAHVETPAIVGSNVIVGVVDTGIDYEHLDFRADTDGDGIEESTRILAIWDQTFGLLGGIKYSRQEIDDDLAAGHGPGEGNVRIVDTNGHGTHVAGIAAGDGSSSAYGFVGIAPGAWIVAVKTTFFTSDILAGVEYVFEIAEQHGMPAVVNLSLGGHEGPHDGTSLFEQGLDELADRDGRIIVVSAGNEGDEQVHVGEILTHGSLSTFEIEVSGWETELSLWYPGTSQFTLSLQPPIGSPIVVPSGGVSGYQTTASGMAYLDNASGGQNPSNRDHEAYLRLTGTTPGDRWRITVTDAGGAGRYDAWLLGEGTVVGGDGRMTIDEPGNAQRVITVGSFNTKSSWISVNGQESMPGFPLGARSGFSSVGPTRDGRQKPELCAPGAWILAPLSTAASSLLIYTHADGVHTAEIGTSMAAPHVSGAVALLLSLNPDLDYQEVRNILTSTAAQDFHTGAVPNDGWGYGKLNIGAAIEALAAIEPPIEPPTPVAVPTIQARTNPVATEASFDIELPDGTRQAWLRVFTISGREVLEVALPVAQSSYVWDLRNGTGEQLASGLYLAIVATDTATSEIEKVVIAR